MGTQKVKRKAGTRRDAANRIRCLLPKDKFYVNLEETGNTESSTVMIGLKQNLDAGKITPGMKVMVTGFGVGLSWGGTVLKF